MMPWWSWRPGHGGNSDTRSRTAQETAVRIGAPAPRESDEGCLAERAELRALPAVVAPVTLQRIGAALDRLDVRYLSDGAGNLMAMWERHAVLFALEGPDDEILVMRTRLHATVPPDWADRAYRAINEWNHTQYFCKAYMGDPTGRGQLPIYAEVQVPLGAGAHDALLMELLTCGTVNSEAFVDWLYDEGGLL